MKKAEKGIIFDIGSFMTEDGPGIRSVVFMKGCPLRCAWCSNAYGLHAGIQMAFLKKKCSGCGCCVAVCPVHAIILEEGQIQTDFSKCINCGRCVDICPTRARTMIGREVTTEEVLEQCLKDAPFFKRNQGGVTVSGGEILLQAEFVLKLLTSCKKAGIHTAIETSCFGKWEDLSRILDVTDFVFNDVKHMDDEMHKKFTGVSNQRILKNISMTADYCAKSGKCHVLRIPLIPDINDDEKNLSATAEFVKNLSGEAELNVLPYHRLGSVKYENIGSDYTLRELGKNSKERLDACRTIFERHKIEYSIGGSNVKKYREFRH